MAKRRIAAEYQSLKKPHLFLRLHGGEKKNLLDVKGTSEEHGHTVNSETPSGSRGETELKSAAEVFIKDLGLIISLSLVLGLGQEALTLNHRVVQLSVCVTNFLSEDKEFETLSKTGVVAVVLGEGRHELGLIHNEAGVDDLVLEEVTSHSVEKTSGREGRRTVEVKLLALLDEEGVGLIGLEGEGNLESAALLNSGNETDTLEGRGEVDLDVVLSISLVGDLVRTGDGLDHAGDELLGDTKEIVVVPVGGIELARCELGVVSEIDTFVSEETSDLVHTVKSTNNEGLEVKLGSNTHEHLLLELVVIGLERTSGSTTRLDVKNRGLYLEETTRVEETADVVDNLGTSAENITNSRGEDKIEVSLTVTNLLVKLGIGVLGIETRQHTKTRGKKNDFLGEDRKLTTLGLSGESAASNDISTTEDIVNLLLGFLVLSDAEVTEELDGSTISGEVIEGEVLSLVSLHGDTTSDDDFLGLVTSL